jgi:TonB family protein
MLPSAVSLAVFYLIYKIFVGKDTHFQVRRFSILGILIFAMVLPFLNFQIAINTETGGFVGFYQNLFLKNELPVFTVFADSNSIAAVETLHATSLPIYKIIGWFYLSVVLILLGRGMVGMLHLAMFSRNGKKLSTNTETIISSSKIPTAFSFFSTIFMPETQFSDDEKEMMLRHERVHVYQKHSWDLLLMNVICAIQFFNPFVWLLKYEMRLNHEFLADKGALENTEDSERYFSLLFQKIAGKQPILVHSFHYSPLKHRLMMQITKPAKMLNQVRYLAFIPVALALTFLFACREKPTTSQEGDYIFLNAKQLKPLGIQLSEKGLFYFNCNSNWEAEGERFPCMALYSTDEGPWVSSMLSTSTYDAPEDLKPVFKGTEITDIGFRPKFVGNPQGHFWFGTERYRDEKLVPISVCMASAKISNRTDTVIFWFLPSESLQKALPRGVKMENFLKYSIDMTIEEPNDSEVFIVVEDAPQFPGGDEARMKFLAENIRYPAEARDLNIQGTVFVSFVVEKNGRVSNIEVIRGIGGGCDDEVVRVVEKMPKWIPGKQDGEPVRVQFTMPVRFSLGG